MDLVMMKYDFSYLL